MSVVAVLTAVEATNALMTLAVNAMVQAQKMNAVIQQAHQTGLPIPKESWDAALADADAADKRLGDAIRAAQTIPPVASSP